MKTIYKSNKNKILALGLAMAFVVSLEFFVQSCSQNNVLDDIKSDDVSITTKYLDLDVTRTTLFTPEEMGIIGQASCRIIRHMVFDSSSDKYVFDLKSPSEINISERLFNYVYPGINMNGTNVPRLKDDNCETTSGWGWSNTTCYMNDQQMVQNFQSLINLAGNASSAIGGAAAVVGLIPGGQTYSAALGFLALSISAQGSTIQSYNNYINTSNRTGGTVTATTVIVMNAGTVTTYQFGFNKK
jgi:hypothetical protein